MSRKIMLIQGHPDSAESHFCHALAEAYRASAEDAGHEVRAIVVADLEFPLLRSANEFAGELPAALEESREVLHWADHLLLVYPLWLGSMPALLKGWFEQLCRPGVALTESDDGKGWPKPLLKGKSCRIVVTMGMPALAYRWYYRAHSLKSLERNILKFSGIAPISETLIGMVDGMGEDARQQWLENLRRMGRSGS